MAQVTCKLIMRSDTAADWTTHNPILANGEIGFETDTRLFKWGDGVTAWTNLTYNSNFSGTIDITGTIEASGGIDRLTTTTGYVDVGSSAAPLLDQVLRATGTSAATWQDIDYVEIVTATTISLDSIFHIINTSTDKALGYQVFNTTLNKPVWALGSDDDSIWVDATGSTIHTPTEDVTIAVANGAITYTGQIPTLDITIPVGKDDLTLTGQVPTVTTV